MEIVGGGRVRVFPPSDEKPHKPSSQEIWQESFVLYWYDMKQSVGGFFRLGHEPNYKGGQSQFMICVSTPHGVFRRCTNLPLGATDISENSFSNSDGSLRYRYDGKNIFWTLKDTDLDVSLTVDLIVPPIDAHRREGAPGAEGILGAHVDAACAVSGTMKVKGSTYQLENVFGFRDHAWGPRDMKTMLSHRWVVGTFGKEHSFVAMTFLSTANTLAKFGWVIRGDKVIMASSVAVRSLISEDGATNLGGTLRMTLTTGEVFEVSCEPLYPTISGWIHFVHPALYYDAVCRMTWGDRIGFGVFETSCNIQGGTLRPIVYEGSIGTDGWHCNAKPLLA